MEAVFLKVLNMSLTAGWLILAVMLLRLLLKKAPKSFCCAMWGLVAFRLLCPFSFESVLSLIPSGEPLPSEILYTAAPTIQSGIPLVDELVNPVISQSLAPQAGASVNPTQVLSFIAAHVWLAGAIALLLYGLFAVIRVKWQVRTAMRVRDNIWLCDGLPSPFILGIFRPRIYLSSNLSEEQTARVLAHEQAHLQRRDHWWKPIGFVLLALHWFNPLVWVAYVLLCRDIELACDERVIKAMPAEDKKAYSETLLACSAPRRLLTACPLAFGEVSIKQRVRSVMSYKKPTFWLIAVALVAVLTVGVLFVTNPKTTEKKPYTVTVRDIHSETEGLTFEVLAVDLYGEEPSICVLWKNSSEKQIGYGRFFKILRKDGDNFVSCNTGSGDVISAIGISLPAGETRSVSYSLEHDDLSQSGVYRLVLGRVILDEQTQYWIDFEINYTENGTTDAHYSDAALLHMVQNIANNKSVGFSSNPYDYITARNQLFVTLVGADTAATACFIPRLQNEEVSGLEAYIMAAVCAEITGIGQTDNGQKIWATADEWLALYLGTAEDADAVSSLPKITPVRTWVNWSESGEALFWQKFGDACAYSDLPMACFTSRDEFARFLTETEAHFSYDEMRNNSASFRTVAAQYDETFFAKNDLYVIYLPENSGSIDHTVAQIALENRTLSVQIARQVPQVGTADMAGWFLTFSLPQEYGTRIDRFIAFYDQPDTAQHIPDALGEAVTSAIRNYYPDVPNVPKTDVYGIEYAVLQTDWHADRIVVYAITMFCQYEPQYELVCNFSTHTAAMLTFSQPDQNGVYHLLDYQTPKGNADYVAEVRKLFPAHLAEKALNLSVYAQAQRGSCVKQAIQRLQKMKHF